MSDYRRHQAWTAGARAAEQGLPESANKRQRGTIYFDDWCDGYEFTKHGAGTAIGIEARSDKTPKAA